jgi:hypothetical protein
MGCQKRETGFKDKQNSENYPNPILKQNRILFRFKQNDRKKEQNRGSNK